MGLQAIYFEVYQPPVWRDIFQGITPVKTEPEILRSISELVSMQVLTQQMITQLAGFQGGKPQTNQSFIRQGQRADEGAAFDDSVQQVRLLSQRVEELEKRLDEAAGKREITAGAGSKSAAPGSR